MGFRPSVGHMGTYREDDIAWMPAGACYDEPTAPDFFDGTQPGIATAKRYCDGCPVREPCLEYALRHFIDWGVWGGTDAKERHYIRRGRQAARARLPEVDAG